MGAGSSSKSCRGKCYLRLIKDKSIIQRIYWPQSIIILCESTLLLGFQIFLFYLIQVIDLILKLIIQNSKQMRSFLLIALTISCVFSLTMKHNSPTAAYLSDFRNAELAKHNYDRSLHGCSALVLNDTLNAAAQAYAEQLASTHTFAHSPAAKSGTYGENLYWGWGYPTLTYKLGDASNSWYSEVQYYDYNTFKSNTAGQAVGHFTAMIWKSSTSVGFGIAQVPEDNGVAVYIVANYSPTPNYIGQYAANVPRPI